MAFGYDFHRATCLFCCFNCDVYKAVLVAAPVNVDNWNRPSINWTGLYIMAVADVLGTRISTRARKWQESQNYSKHDCCRQNENDIPINKKMTQSLKTEPKIKNANRLHSLQSTHVWKWPVVKYKRIKIKPRICVLFILCLTWTVNANSLKQNIIVIQEICSWLPLSVNKISCYSSNQGGSFLHSPSKSNTK